MRDGLAAAVASIAFVPMALATGPGAEVQRPLATPAIGGMLSSFVHVLIVTSVIFAWLRRS